MKSFKLNLSFDRMHIITSHPYPSRNQITKDSYQPHFSSLVFNTGTELYGNFSSLQISPAHHPLLSTMEYTQGVPQMSYMVPQSLTHVTPGQREEWSSTSLGRAPSVVQATIKRRASGVAPLLSVNFPSLLFSAHMSTLQMDTRYLARKPHISTMTVWYSSVIMDLLWRAAVRFVAKPITPGILTYQFVKKVKTQWRGKWGIYLFILVCYLPPKARVMEKSKGA